MSQLNQQFFQYLTGPVTPAILNEKRPAIDSKKISAEQAQQFAHTYFCAAYWGDVETFQQLRQAGIKPPPNLLHVVGQSRGLAEIPDDLIRSRPEAKASFGKDPQMSALRNYGKKFIYGRGSMPNYRGVVKELIDAGEEIDQCEHGYTPLMYAAINCNEAVLSALIEAKADVNAVQGDQTAISRVMLSRAEPQQKIRALELLYRNGAVSKDKDGVLDLCRILVTDCSDGVRLVLSRTKNPNVAWKNGLTPLMLAVVHASVSDVRVLLESKTVCAEINLANGKGETALSKVRPNFRKEMLRNDHDAWNQRLREIALALLQKGADPDKGRVYKTVFEGISLIVSEKHIDTGHSILTTWILFLKNQLEELQNPEEVTKTLVLLQAICEKTTLRTEFEGLPTLFEQGEYLQFLEKLNQLDKKARAKLPKIAASADVETKAEVDTLALAKQILCYGKTNTLENLLKKQDIDFKYCRQNSLFRCAAENGWVDAVRFFFANGIKVSDFDDSISEAAYERLNQSRDLLRSTICDGHGESLVQQRQRLGSQMTRSWGDFGHTNTSIYTVYSSNSNSAMPRNEDVYDTVVLPRVSVQPDNTIADRDTLFYDNRIPQPPTETILFRVIRSGHLEMYQLFLTQLQKEHVDTAADEKYETKHENSAANITIEHAFFAVEHALTPAGAQLAIYILQMLVRKNVQLLVKDARGSGLLHYAAHGRLEVVKFLLEDVTEEKNTALVAKNTDALASNITTKQQWLTMVDSQGRTPLVVAQLRRGHGDPTDGDIPAYLLQQHRQAGIDPLQGNNPLKIFGTYESHLRRLVCHYPAVVTQLGCSANDYFRNFECHYFAASGKPLKQDLAELLDGLVTHGLDPCSPMNLGEAPSLIPSGKMQSVIDWLAENEYFESIVQLQYREKCCKLVVEFIVALPGFSHHLHSSILSYLFLPIPTPSKTDASPLADKWKKDGPPGTAASSSSTQTASSNASPSDPNEPVSARRNSKPCVIC